MQNILCRSGPFNVTCLIEGVTVDLTLNVMLVTDAVTISQHSSSLGSRKPTADKSLWRLGCSPNLHVSLDPQHLRYIGRADLHLHCHSLCLVCRSSSECDRTLASFVEYESCLVCNLRQQGQYWRTISSEMLHISRWDKSLPRTCSVRKLCRNSCC